MSALTEYVPKKTPAKRRRQEIPELRRNSD